MARTGTAAHSSHETGPTPHDPKPANDIAVHAAAQASVPTYALTAEQRRRCRQEAMRVAATKVSRRLPTHMDERLGWLGSLQATAWRDQGALAQVSFGSDGAVTRDEIDAFGVRIEFAREVIAGRGLSAPAVVVDASVASVAPMSDGALKGAIRGAQIILCNALAPRFASVEDPDASVREKRRAVQKVRRNRAAKALAGHSARLFALCDHAEIAAWLPTLPKGEGAALQRLRALHPEWVRRAKLASTPDDARELVLRAWALVMASVPRILMAGRYLVNGDPAREKDYGAFHSRKTRAAKVAPVVSPPPVG